MTTLMDSLKELKVIIEEKAKKFPEFSDDSILSMAMAEQSLRARKRLAEKLKNR
jgi:hypothetical protein